MNFPPPLQGDPRDRLLQAFQRIELFQDRLLRECGDQIACGEGCDACCQQVLHLRGVEAAYLIEGVRGLGEEARSLVWCALGDATERCPLLHGGVCLVYEHRPAVCRSHGLPMFRRESQGLLLHHCPRNFTDVDPTGLPPALLLDEERLALVMDTVDALYARITGWNGDRVSVDELLRFGLQQ